MKIILIITCILFSILSCKRANEEFITLCKTSDSLIRIYYLDSAHGISDIETFIKADTLELIVNVAFMHEQKDYDIPIKPDIKCIKVGTKTFDLVNVTKCPKVLSGQEAIDSIK